MQPSYCLLCRGGLEGRLLGMTLQAEHPQLESQCSALLQQQEEQRLELAALDSHLLQSLATSKVSPFAQQPQCVTGASKTLCSRRCPEQHCKLT